MFVPVLVVRFYCCELGRLEKKTNTAPYMVLILYVSRMMQNQFIKATLCERVCEHNRYTISYILRNFLSVIIRESLYWLKLFRNVRHSLSLAHILKFD